MAGALVATIIHSKKTNIASIWWWLGFIVIVGTLVFGSAIGWQDSLSRILACAATSICLLSRYSFRHAAFKPIVYLGDLSYSLYLWHWPLICFAAIYGFNLGEIGLSIWLIVLSVVLAVISYEFVEKFGTRRYSKRWLPPVLLGSMVVTAIASQLLSDSKDAAWRVTPTYSTEPYSRPTDVRYINSKRASGESITDCLLEQPERKSILSTGDSHANYFIPLVKSLCDNKDYKMETFHGTNGFHFSPNLRYHELDPDGSIAKTKRFNETATFLIKYLEQADYVSHVLVAHRTASYVSLALKSEQRQKLGGEVISETDSSLNSKESYEVEFRQFIDKVRSMGKTVVLIGQAPPISRTPNYQITLFDRVLAKLTGKPNPSYSNTDLILSSEVLKRLDFETDLYQSLSKTDSNIHYLPTKNIITQPIDNKGHLLYTDDDHLAPSGALKLLPALEKLVK